MNRLLGTFAITATLALFARAVPAAAAELLMFEQDFCPWCEAWDAEIAETYPRTAEGKRLPLRRLDIAEPVPDGVALEQPVRFTPTFVVVVDGAEVARITGYTGEYQFWGLLGQIAARLETPGG